MEMREVLTQYGFDGENVPIIAGSGLCALQGIKPEIGVEAIKKLMKAVDEYIPTPKRDFEKPFLMPIEDVFSIAGRGTVVTGRVERGVLNKGQDVEIVGFGKTTKTTVTGIEMFHKDLDRGEAGDNMGALLRGLKREDIRRGQVLAQVGTIKSHKKFKASLYILTKEEGGRHTPFVANYRPQMYFRTCDVTAIVNVPGREMTSPGDNVEAEMELMSDVALEHNTRFTIREGGKTVGTGKNEYIKAKLFS